MYKSLQMSLNSSHILESVWNPPEKAHIMYKSLRMSVNSLHILERVWKPPEISPGGYKHPLQLHMGVCWLMDVRCWFYLALKVSSPFICCGSGRTDLVTWTLYPLSSGDLAAFCRDVFKLNLYCFSIALSLTMNTLLSESTHHKFKCCHLNQHVLYTAIWNNMYHEHMLLFKSTCTINIYCYSNVHVLPPKSICIISSSNWILMSYQPHKVTSGQSNSGHKQIHISKLFSRIYQPSVKSIHKTSHFANTKHTYTNNRHKFSKSQSLQ